MALHRRVVRHTPGGEPLAAQGVGVDPATTREEIHGVLTQVLTTATLEAPTAFSDGAISGRDGRHTDELVPLLAEMQKVAREHPEATW